MFHPNDLQIREILHKVHQNRIKNKKGLNRVSRYISTDTLGVKKNFFKNKVVAELGCGSHGGGGYNLLKLGAKYVHLLDVNQNVKKGINTHLKKFKGKYKIHINSIDKLPFENKYFDFVNCAGVLHHVNKPYKSFREIHRVLKKNGVALISVHGKGGVVTRFVMEILRDEYNNSKNSKKILDKIMSGNIKPYSAFLKKELNNKNYKIIKNILEKISDNDFRMTIKDRILSPKYEMFDEKKLKKKLYSMGFKNFKRTPIKPNYQNIRDLLVPFYFNYKHPLSEFLYGQGQIRFTVQKK